jgi:hypothetical protein
MRIIIMLNVLIIASFCFADTIHNLEELECPCHVKSFDMYLDGGTLGGVIEDAKSNILGFCLDRRLHVIKFDANEKPPSNKFSHFFIGAEHPTLEGARPLEVDGDEERLLMSILSAWIESVLPAAKYKEVIGQYNACKGALGKKELIRDNLLTEEQARALWVNQMVLNREIRLSTFNKN